jgi:hypothetical protein
MALDLGDILPRDLVVLDSLGRDVRLADLRGEVALLIFLRHLG